MAYFVALFPGTEHLGVAIQKQAYAQEWAVNSTVNRLSEVKRISVIFGI